LPTLRSMRRLVLSSLQTDMCDRIRRLVVDSSIKLPSATLPTGDVGILVLDLGWKAILRLPDTFDSMVEAYDMEPTLLLSLLSALLLVFREILREPDRLEFKEESSSMVSSAKMLTVDALRLDFKVPFREICDNRRLALREDAVDMDRGVTDCAGDF